MSPFALALLAGLGAVSVDTAPAAGWRVVYRKGVVKDTVTPGAAGPLFGLEIGAGGYAEVAPAQAPAFAFTAGEVSLAVEPPPGEPVEGQVGVRLVDAGGEIFQARVRAIPAGGGTMRFRFPEEFAESWGDSPDKRLDPPLRLQTLVVAGPLVQFRLRAVSFEERLGRRPGWYELDLQRGGGFHYRHEVQASAAATPDGPRLEMQVPNRGYAEWNCHAFRSSRFDSGDCIRVKLRVDRPLPGALLSLRILDARDECFQAARVALLEQPGEQTVEVPLDTKAFGESWGRNKDGVLDFPIRVASVLTASDKPGSVAITLRSVALRKGMSAAEGLALSFDAGTRFHLLPPGAPAKATLRVRNQFADPVAGRLSIRFRDAWGKIGFERDEELSLAAGASREIPLALPALRPGAYTGEFLLTGQDGKAETIEAPARLAVMLPNGPAKRRDGFAFSVCTHTERFGERGLVDEPEAAGLLGLRVARTFPGWRQMEPRQGAFDWAYADRFVENYARNGMELQPIVSDTPDWALLHPGKRGSTQPPRPEAFAAFGRAMAEHFRGKVRYYEIWNEPDIGFWQGTPDEYLAAYKAVVPAIRQGDPKAVVMTGGFVSPDRNPAFLRKFLEECGTLFDVFAIHMHGPFEIFERGVVDGLDPVLATLKRKVPVYFNETAVSATLSGGELAQAQQLVKKVVYAMSRGAIGYTWYDLRNDGCNAAEPEDNYGLMTNDLQPKPNYVAYNTLVRHLGDASFLRRVDSDPSVYLYSFRTAEGLALVGWCDNPSAQGRVYALTSNARSVACADHQGGIEEMVRGGSALVALGPDPRFFLLRGASKVDDRLEPVVAQDTAIPVFAGTRAAVALRIRNPLPKPVKGMLDVAGAPVSFAAPAGASAQVRVLLEVPAAVAANVYPVRARLDLGPGGPPARAFDLPIFLSRPLGGPAIVLDRPETVHNFHSADPKSPRMHWKGAADLSMRLRVDADDEALLVVAEVTDDTHRQGEEPAEMWRGDSLQVGVLAPGTGAPVEVGAALLGERVTRACWMATAGTDTAQVAQGFTAEVRREGALTTYRLRLPLAVLRLRPADLARGIALNVVANDNDGDGRKGVVQLSPGLAEAKTPDRWFRFARPGRGR